MRKLIYTLAIVIFSATIASAQVSVPNTFVTGTRILASEMNANFDALESGALNRTGGTITGNISVDSGITIDGIDVGGMLGGTGDVTFDTIITTGNVSIGGDLALTGGFVINTDKFSVAAASGNTLVLGTLGVTGTTTGTAATWSGTLTANGATDVNGTFTIGSGNVQPFTSAGKIEEISTTYFDDLSGVNLTGVAKLGSLNTFTAQNDFLDYSETFASPTISAGSLTLDLNTGSHFTVALNANISTLTVSNVPSSKAVAFTVQFTADGTLRTVSWPSGTVWAGAAAPTMTSTNAKRDFFTFITYDGGTTWFGFVGGQNF